MEAQSSPEDGWASPEDMWSNLTSGVIAPSFSWAFKALRISNEYSGLCPQYSH